MFRIKNRISQYFDDRANNIPHAGDGASLMGKTKTKPTAAVNPMAELFGDELQIRCKSLAISREQFYAKCRTRFPDAKDVTFTRWWNGLKLPQRGARGWFEEEFGIVIPETRTGQIETVAARPPQVVETTALMEYATGSIHAAITSTDEQIVHDVKDSLKDPAQSPWMRIAVTLIRQAHQRSR